MIAFIDDHRGAHGVEPICKDLPIAPSPLTSVSTSLRRFLAKGSHRDLELRELLFCAICNTLIVATEQFVHVEAGEQELLQRLACQIMVLELPVLLTAMACTAPMVFFIT
jgi:hypothetical protein